MTNMCNSTMKNVHPRVVSERHTSWMFNNLQERLQHPRKHQELLTQSHLSDQSNKRQQQTRKVGWTGFPGLFGVFTLLLSPVVSKGNSLDGTTPSEEVTLHLHNTCRLCDAPDTAWEWHAWFLVRFQALLENLCLLHPNWNCHALLIPFFI